MTASHTATAQILADRTSDASSQHVLLKTLLDDLANKHGLRFNHNAAVVRDVYISTVGLANTEDIEQKLNQALAGTGLQCKKMDKDTYVIRSTTADATKKNIVVAERPTDAPSGAQSLIQPVGEIPALTAAVYHAMQEVSISGRVADKETNAPMARVTVRLKGSKTGVISDQQGNFKLTLPDAQGTLVFTFIGYRTVELPLDGKTTVNVFMEVDWKLLEDVVVTSLGIKKETKKLGYATAVVKGEETTQAREVNFANTLTGRVAGVNVTAPAAGAGGSSRVTIRGNTSISNDNQPLYVVNGIPIDNSNLGSANQWGGFDAGDGISSLNPDDIESINILKGATAAALYGSRAKNGVILVTTKRGKGGERGIGVEFNSNLVFENVRNYFDPQTQYGQGNRGARPMSTEAAAAAGLRSWGAKLDGTNAMQFDGTSAPYSLQSNNFNDFYRTGLTFTNTLALGGASDNIMYRLSVSDLSNTSVYPNSLLNRKIFNANMSYKLLPQLTGDVSVNYTTERSNNRPNQSDSPGNGNFTIGLLPTNMRASILRGTGEGTTKFGSELAFTDNPYATNPYFAAYKFQNATQKDRIIASTNLKYNFTDWLYLQGRVGQDYYTFGYSSITPTGTAYLPQGSFGIADRGSRTFAELNADVLLAFDKDLSEDVSLAASVGANLRTVKNEMYGTYGSSLVFPNIYNPQFATNRIPSYSIAQREVQSVYGSVELSYKEMFFLNATARNDWFSTVAVGNYSYLYPSVSGSFVFSELVKTDWLTFGKLRLAYANVGADTDPYATKLYYNISGTINGNPIGDFDKILPNQRLKPLNVSEVEAGLELKLFDGRVTLDAAWYQKDTRDEIVTATVSGTSGFTAAVVNNGQLQNTGVELLLSGRIIDETNYGWTSSLNFSMNNNQVVRLAEGQQSLSIAPSRTFTAFIQHRVGQPFAQVVAYDYARDKQGNVVYDESGLPKQGELVALGSGVHPYAGGWYNEFRYGNLRNCLKTLKTLTSILSQRERVARRAG
jgi:TonB-linked SusC/RagA family outer membrane protein